MTNLLANAVRHAPAGSDLWVLARQHGAKVRIEVSDRGAGVAEEARDEIFTAFRRGEGSRSTGIGLAICRSIVRLHGGRAWAEQMPGGFTAFRFSLPLEPAPVAPVEGPD